MTILYCDICGTSYPDTEESCPVCGYSRAFEEETPYASRTRSEPQKVRGGRFSKKNVARRRKLLEELAEAALKAEQLKSESKTEVMEAPAADEEPVAEVREEPAAEVQEGPGAEVQEEAESVAAEEETREEAEPVDVAADIPQPEEAQEEIQPEPELESEQMEAVPVWAELIKEEPEEGPTAPEEEAEAEPEEEPEISPVVIPESEFPAEPEQLPAELEAPAAPEEIEEEEDSQKAVLKAYRRDVRRNLMLFTAIVVFLLSMAFLVKQYALPYVQNLSQPTEAVTEAPTEAPTETPTEAPTEAPTESPTEAPTESPTEAPTEAPTQAPTEAPTQAQLSVKLELNYYDLTMGAVTHVTQLKANGIPSSNITWVSDDTSVVTVSSTGLITAVGGGQTTVRAIYGDQVAVVSVKCPF